MATFGAALAFASVFRQAQGDLPWLAGAPSLRRAQATATFQGLPLLEWSTKCERGYDYCAAMEFCGDGKGIYGYRIPGVKTCRIIDAPVIRVKPGKKYEMTLKNGSPDTTTNIHTHGLHVSGMGNADDPQRELHFGECLRYNWTIPADHMGGTSWYHPHHHGVVAPQASGGAFGIIIVEEVEDFTKDSGVLRWLQNERLLVAARVGTNQWGNGLSNAVIDLVQGEWYRMRIAAVDPKTLRSDLVVVSSTAGCDVRAVAYDGVWRSSVPSPTAMNAYSLTGASRVDVAIRCPNTGDFPITYSGNGANGQVATLSVRAGTVSSATPYVGGKAWTPKRPTYLRDLRTVDSATTQKFSITSTAVAVNGVSFNPKVPLVTSKYDSVQEWSIGTSRGHPFHIHVYRMQVVSGCEEHEMGEFYDTISTKGDCTVRFHMADFGGPVIMHCHVLQHEDQGSMAWIDVKGGPAATTTDLEPYKCDVDSTVEGDANGVPHVHARTTWSLAAATGLLLLAMSLQ